MSRSQFKFLRRVRIHDGECGAVARALHHEAEGQTLPAAMEKVSMATNERKIMSKKTFFKRIAMTAIAALGFGVLSVAPSQAVLSGESLTIGAASTDTTTTYASTIAVNETATAVLRHTWTSTSPGNESVVVTAIRATAGTGTLRMTLTDSATSQSTTTQPAYFASGAADAVNLIGTDAAQLRSGAASAVTTYTVSDTDGTGGRSINSTVSLRFIAPSVAGTYNFTVSTALYKGLGASGDGTEGKSVTWTVTVTAADVVATSASTSTLRTGEALLSDGTIEGTDSAVIASRLATSTRNAAATIWINQKNAAGTANESMTVTVSGPAWVSTDSGTAPTSGTAVTLRNLGPVGATYSYSGLTPIFIYSTGTAGIATVTVSTVSGLVLGTETVTFVGSVTSIAIENTFRKILRAGGGTNGTDQPTIAIRATDANGNSVSGLTFSLVSSNTTAVNSAAAAAAVCAEDATDPGFYECVATTTATSTSGQAATLTYRVVNPAVTTSTAYFTVDHAVTLGGSVSTWTVTANKASYEPGEAMILTATGVDASGNPISDGSAGPTFLASNKNLGGTALSSVFNTVYDGKSTTQVRNSAYVDVRTFRTDNTLYAPAASGKFLISGNYGTGGAKSISLELTVSDDAATAAAAAATDAALEAIDAANAATDAANLAAEAADAATVAAEEARDAADAATAAVEALATEVATLMAALKAQITTLANTVAKIAKKVKA
jgi:hypothetical protein